MAILTTVNWLSEQRADISDMRRVESAVRNDFDTTVSSIFTGTSQGYIIRGFSLVVGGAIGAPANGLQMVVDPGAVLNINASVSGTIFQTPIGTPNQVLSAAANTNVTGSFTASSTNYVGIDYNRFADPTTDVTKYIWNPSANDEITTIAPAAQTLTFKIYITTSPWASNVLPVAIVDVDSNGNVVSITDARWMIFSLETGGLDPNPGYVYPWSEGRLQSPVTTTSNSVNPFVGGDKQLDNFKSWADAIMTSFLEVKGTNYWFSGSSSNLPIPSLISLFQDLGNTIITGSGQISNGILPNSNPLLVTTGNTTATTNQLTSLGSVAGLVPGDYIFATGIPQLTTIVSISGSTITMSQDATISGTGIQVTFYSPSVITTPGQINWNEPIDIRVIGSSLSYVLAANPSSNDISLTDDQVAYITLIRDVAIGPNLIFTGGSPVVTSVGSVTWTSGLLPGDYIKIASNTVADYYEILTVDSGFQVTLVQNVSNADTTGPTGAQSKYAFGSYLAAPTPTTTRNIYIASRDQVPFAGNVFWLFAREDNGGSPKVYIRFLSQELDNGESTNISGTTSLELLQYIGSPSASNAYPQYVNALNPNSLPQITDITIGGGSTISPSQFFLINSSADARRYVVWFKVSGSGSAPLSPYTNDTIEVDILTGDTATQVASKLAIAFNTAEFLDFSAVAGVGTVVVTNTSSGACNAASNGNVGAPFAITISQSGTGQGNYIIHDNDNLTLAIKELDLSLGSLIASLDNPSYDEIIKIVASGGTPPTSVNGPLSPGTNITLPLNSRESNALAQYTVGNGTLLLFLNGQFLDLESGAYTEVGVTGEPSNTIQTQIALVVGDELEIRFSGAGGGGGGGGGIGPAGPAGPQGPIGFNSATGPVAVSTKTGNYNILTGDCFLGGDATSGNIVLTLPVSSGNTGRIFYIKKIDSSVNTVTVMGNGSDFIDGSNTFVLTTQYQSLSVIDNGTGWWVF